MSMHASPKPRRQKVAKTRNLTGASLNLRMHAAGDPYYNVYCYAFFGKVPEINEGDPAPRAREAKAAGKRLFASKRSR